eukprot:6834006-Alexandrium_andersonii.AAC.1
MGVSGGGGVFGIDWPETRGVLHRSLGTTEHRRRSAHQATQAEHRSGRGRAASTSARRLRSAW